MTAIDERIARAREAQALWEKTDQQTRDRAVRAMAKAVFDRAEPLARLAVDETRMGVYEDKVKKNRGKARILWNSLRDRPSVGVLSRDAETGIVEIAKPAGVVGAVTPCTNPVVTPLCNGMFALKAGDAVVFAPHPRALRTAAAFLDAVAEGFAEAGVEVPEGLLQALPEADVELTRELMAKADVVVATGGMAMVKSAYASGTPAFGVGPGNVQCLLHASGDAAAAVPLVLEGRRFDNGIICSGEQSLLVPAARLDEVKALLATHGGYLVEGEAARARLIETLFDDGVLRRECVGVTAIEVAQRAGLEVPAETSVLVAPVDPAEESLLRKEKMCPVMALFACASEEEALAVAAHNLELEGKGHSVSVHATDAAFVERVGAALPVARVVVNQACSTSAGGSFANGFRATTTLGCGFWGNNAISENLDFTHLMNVTRLGLSPRQTRVPDDAELWG